MKMLNRYDSYRLLITPLSPVHIGTGDSYDPTQYVIDEHKTLHEFDVQAIMAVLTQGERDELLRITSRPPNNDLIENLQKFFFERRTALMSHALQRLPVLPGVASLYRRRIGQAASIEHNGNRVFNKLEIERTAIDPITRLPVLFGSSLKGAVRTALLDQINDGDRARPNEKNQALQQRLLEYQRFEQDPMRLVQFADAPWTGEAGLPATQIHLAVNRKKVPVVDARGQLRASTAETKDLYQILQCLAPWRYRAFSAQLNLQRSPDDLKQHRADQWPHLQFDMNAVINACNRFYQPIFKTEKQALRERNYLDTTWDKATEQLLAAQKDRAKNPAFLLRVGRHSGAESMTLNGIRDIKIQQGRNPAIYQDHALTWWLASDEIEQKSGLLPFGWLWVEVQPWTAPNEEWPAFKTLCEPHLSSARAFAAQINQQQAIWQQKRQEIAAQKQAELQAQRQQQAEIERQQQAEIERQHYLQTLTPNLKAVEDFKSSCKTYLDARRGKPDKPNTVYHNRAKELYKQSRQDPAWTATERQQAEQAVREWLPKLIEGGQDQLKKLLKSP